MKNLQKNLSHMLVLLLLLFAAMGIYLVYVAAFESDSFITSPFNARVAVDVDDFRRGSIYDIKGSTLAYSQYSSGAYTRIYPFNATFAHVVGYSGVSRAGLELTRNFNMHNLSWEALQRAGNVMFNSELSADYIITTLDSNLQSLIYSRMAGIRGAVVVINPNSGAILAMVSTPGFDPNNVVSNWGQLIADPQAPLLNRATQGLYPPGSTFKVVTALAALKEDPTLADFEFNCTGHATFGDYALQCFGGNAHGLVDMHRAMAVSCNGYFAYIANKIGAQSISAAANSFGFNTPPIFELAATTPQFPMYAPAMDELIQTSIGQGRTLATPLNMAMIAATIANGGFMMQPYIVYGVASGFGGGISRTSPSVQARVMDASYAEILNQMLVLAVNTGTAAPAALSHMQVAGKTGTAQNETGIDHSWFIGHAPAYNPQMALAIIIENTGGGTVATRLAGEIFGQIDID